MYFVLNILNITTYLFQSGNTPLHYAVKNERVEIVKLLLKRVDIQKYKVNKVCNVYTRIVKYNQFRQQSN